MKKLGILMITILLICGCTNSKVSSSSLKDGTYSSTQKGFKGDVEFSVEVKDGKLSAIEVVNSSETENIGGAAFESLIPQIIESQNIGLDVVSGATYSSNALKAALEDVIVQAGGKVEDFKKEVSKSSEVVEENYDIVVIGSGGAGFAASITAAQHGAKVLLLEKTAVAGGTTANGGGFFAADSEQAQSLGHEMLDTTAIAEKYMEEMDWKADANLLNQFFETSKTTAYWLTDLGLKFHKTEVAVQQTHAEGTNGYHKYDDFTATSKTFMDILSKQDNLVVYYETPATEILVKDGIVSGVKAVKKDGTTLNISAKSVIIATGGFVGNAEMSKEALNGVTVNPAGYNTNVGDGINMALKLNAATRGMEAMVAHTFKVVAAENITGEYDPMSKMHASASIAYLPTNLWINQHGVRYANEDIVYDRALSTHALIAQGDYAYFVLNQEMLDKLESSGASALGMEDKIAMGPFSEYTPMSVGWANLNAIVSEMVDDKSAFKAESVEELASKLNIDEKTLVNTFAHYNELSASGKDVDYNKRPAHMFALNEGPYYAFRVEANNLSTVGGLRIDNKFNVVLNDPENGYTPIKNLYAAGADAAGIYSDHYAHTIEGTAQGWAYNSGRLAGKYAVENALGIEIVLEK